MADLLTNLAAAAGAAGGENLYIEDVFSTYLYTGTGASLPIVNGIDLDAEGGLVWSKLRDGVAQNKWYDSARGITFAIESDNTGANQTEVTGITSFNSNGYTYGADGNTNSSGGTYVSWTFRKAPKFFDILTYTGTGVNRTVAHNLGSVPGCIMVKRTDTTGNWQVYHRANTANPETDYLVLNDTAATADSNTRWNDTAPTDAVFSLGTEATVNASGGTYVAYLFAHDAGGFGDDGEQNVISCGSYVGNGGTQDISVGFEPQWVLIKNIDNSSNWALFDNMRSFIVDSSADSLSLRPNATTAEGSATNSRIGPRPNGFGFISEGGGDVNSGAAYTYIYIAIRRGPMKTPTAGTEVYDNYTGSDTVRTNVGFNADLVIGAVRTGDALNHIFGPRLTVAALTSSSTAAETANISSSCFNGNSDTIYPGMFGVGNAIINALARAPGFFDVVCWTGDDVAGRNVNHNLGVTPELIWVKRRNSPANHWYTYHTGMTGGVDALHSTARLNLTEAGFDTQTWKNYSFTSTTFSIDNGAATNASGGTYIAYLFATLAGISKVGSYTGTGTSVTVTTGFQPRFILVKRTDSTGNWIVGDSARGLVAGDDPALFLNSTAAETTGQDWVDVSATGFTVNETALNANVDTGNYIYLAIS
jgi:hypothetical protein